MAYARFVPKTRLTPPTEKKHPTDNILAREDPTRPHQNFSAGLDPLTDKTKSLTLLGFTVLEDQKKVFRTTREFGDLDFSQ